MTATININIPSLAVHAIYLVILFSLVIFAFYAGHIKAVRENERDVRRRATQQLQMPWCVPGEADVIRRPSPEITIFRARPYRRDDDLELAA